jgi:hypothetical protein
MTTPLTTYEMWYGRNAPPPEIIPLRAGPIELDYEAGDLRYLRVGGREIVRRIYVAVRDVNWNTIPARMSGLEIDAGRDHFQIRYEAYHEGSGIAFRWRASFKGSADGVITCAMEGTAESDFRYCRIGFCVLHPVDGTAGSAYRAVTPEGAISGTIPLQVAPQRIANGFEVPIFPSCSSLTLDFAGGSVAFDFEGDLFEMEDQRNWTDGSYKTYCTPISLGYPHQARTGQRIDQRVTVRVVMADAGQTSAADGGVNTFALGAVSERTLPKLGLAMASHGGALTQREIERLARIKPDHLRAEVRFSRADWENQLVKAADEAKAVGSALELVLFLTDAASAELTALAEKVFSMPVARVIVFHEAEAGRHSTSAQWIKLAREHLAAALPGVPLIGGTNGNFAELNREPPDFSLLDGASFTLNPQVHAFDERSLIENIRAQADAVASLKQLSGGLPAVVSGVTLKQPFNPVAKEAETAPDPNTLPTPVDPRQMSLFAAAWTVGSIAALTDGGADAFTYYETTGWRGLMEVETGSPLPAQFRSGAGMIFPVYWVFAMLADMKGAQVVEAQIGRRLLLEGLALQKDGKVRVLIANLLPSAQSVQVTGLPAGTARITQLNEQTMPAAAFDPGTFEGQSAPLAVESGRAELVLLPYETAFIEIDRS